MVRGLRETPSLTWWSLCQVPPSPLRLSLGENFPSDIQTAKELDSCKWEARKSQACGTLRSVSSTDVQEKQSLDHLTIYFAHGLTHNLHLKYNLLTFKSQLF